MKLDQARFSARLLSVLLFWGTLFTSPVHADLQACIYEALRPLTEPDQQTGVELEIVTSREMMRLLTTTDGTLGAALKPAEEIPTRVRNWIKNQREWRKKDPLAFPWEQIPVDLRIELLQELSSNRGQLFFRNRSVHGLVMKKKIRVKLTEKRTFLGRTYPPGTHEIDISRVATNQVEYRGPDEVKDFGGVELHLRSRDLSGNLSLAAVELLDLVGVPRIHQHVHVVSELPIQRLKAQPEIQSAMMADLWRRGNLAAEMIGIVEYRVRVTTVREGEVVYFDSLKSSELRTAYDYFRKIASGQQPKLGDSLKMAYVGLRGPDTYQIPEGQARIWGLEYRAIPKAHDPRISQEVLNAIQATMTEIDYGIDRKQFLAALQFKKSNPLFERLGIQMANDPGAALSKTYYNRSSTELIKDIDAPQAFIDALENHQELKMILFDWSADPLVYGDLAAQQKIRDAQIEARKKLFEEALIEGEQPFSKSPKILPVIKKFLLDSGLYQKVLDSLGIRRTAFTNPEIYFENRALLASL